jgi:hypothetical protein
MNFLNLEAAAAHFIQLAPSERHLIVKGLQIAKRNRVSCDRPGVYRVLGSRGDLYTVLFSKRTRTARCTCFAHKRCYHRWALNILWWSAQLPQPGTELLRSGV